MLRIRQLGLPKGCAVIPPDPRKSREERIQRDLSSVTAFRRFGEWDFYACSHAGRPRAVPAGKPPAHPKLSVGGGQIIPSCQGLDRKIPFLADGADHIQC